MSFTFHLSLSFALWSFIQNLNYLEYLQSHYSGLIHMVTGSRNLELSGMDEVTVPTISDSRSGILANIWDDVFHLGSFSIIPKYEAVCLHTWNWFPVFLRDIMLVMLDSHWWGDLGTWIVWNGWSNCSFDLWFKVRNSCLHQFQFKLNGLIILFSPLILHLVGLSSG